MTLGPLSDVHCFPFVLLPNYENMLLSHVPCSKTAAKSSLAASTDATKNIRGHHSTASYPTQVTSLEEALPIPRIAHPSGNLLGGLGGSRASPGDASFGPTFDLTSLTNPGFAIPPSWQSLYIHPESCYTLINMAPNSRSLSDEPWATNPAKPRSTTIYQFTHTVTPGQDLMTGSNTSTSPQSRGHHVLSITGCPDLLARLTFPRYVEPPSIQRFLVHDDLCRKI